MPSNDNPKIKCYVIISSDKEFSPIVEAMKTVSKDIKAQLISSKNITPFSLEDSIYIGEI